MNTKKQLFTGMLVLLTQLFVAQSNNGFLQVNKPENINNGVSVEINDSNDFKLETSGAPGRPIWYCTSKNERPEGQYITEVGFSGVTNSTRYNSGYELYDFEKKGINVNVTKGPYTNLNEAGLMSIKVENAWENTKVGCWVDWNQDGDFDDASEKSILTSASNPTRKSWLRFFVVPSSAKLGKTRMRIRAVHADQISPCGYEWFGETEDYVINVTPPRNSVTAFPNPSVDGKFNFSNIEISKNVTFKVFDIYGRLFRVISGVESEYGINTPLDLSDLRSGIYMIQVFSNEKEEIIRVVIQ